MPFPPSFLGLDLSTQGLKAIIITSGLRIIHESFLSFDSDLPQYKTTNGTIRGPEGKVTSPIAMWLDALDLLLERMKVAGVDFGTIVAVSGAGQVRPTHIGRHFTCIITLLLCSNMGQYTGRPTGLDVLCPWTQQRRYMSNLFQAPLQSPMRQFGKTRLPLPNVSHCRML